MAKIDKLLKDMKLRIQYTTPLDYSKLTTDELKELAYGEPTEQRFNELVDKMG